MFNEQRNMIENTFIMVIITKSQNVAIPLLVFMVASLNLTIQIFSQPVWFIRKMVLENKRTENNKHTR